MVKGLSRKVIIVKSPDQKIFEQAIFIVRDEYAMKQGISQKELLKQAREAADGYISEAYGSKQHPLKSVSIILAALLFLGVAFSLGYFLF